MSAEIETLHKPFRAWLEKLTGQVAYTHHRADRATGATLGDADFVLYSTGRCLHIEFKDKETHISAAQKKRHAELARCGTCVHIIRDLQAAINLTLEWRSQVGTVAPVEAKPTHDLRVRGNAVFEYRDGQLYHVRVATENDKIMLKSL